VFTIWYPLTQRARVDVFFAELEALKLPPTLTLELAVAGEASGLKMRGCGLVIVNPPWQFDRVAENFLPSLTKMLTQAPDEGVAIRWFVPE